MNSMIVDYRLVLAILGAICALFGVFLIVKQNLKMKPYTGRVMGKLVDYEDTYETTKEGVQTISQRVFYPVFTFEVAGQTYKKSTARQFFEADQRPTGVDVPVRYNPARPIDCVIYYLEYPLLTPILTLVVGLVVALAGVILMAL